MAQSTDSEQAAWSKRIAIRPPETAQGRKPRRKTWRKPSKTAQDARKGASQGSGARRKTWRKAAQGASKPSKPSQGARKPSQGARRKAGHEKSHAIYCVALI